MAFGSVGESEGWHPGEPDSRSRTVRVLSWCKCLISGKNLPDRTIGHCSEHFQNFATLREGRQGSTSTAQANNTNRDKQAGGRLARSAWYTRDTSLRLPEKNHNRGRSERVCVFEKVTWSSATCDTPSRVAVSHVAQRYVTFWISSTLPDRHTALEDNTDS